MRNALAHGYFKIDLEVVWNAVVRDVPRLKNQVADAVRVLTTDSERARDATSLDEKPPNN